MTKTITCVALLLAPFLVASAGAEEPARYPSGFSDRVLNPQRETVTDWLLQQQRQNKPATQSELPAQLYVDSQRRLGDTFRVPIPDSFGEQTRDRTSR